MTMILRVFRCVATLALLGTLGCGGAEPCDIEADPECYCEMNPENCTEVAEESKAERVARR